MAGANRREALRLLGAAGLGALAGALATDLLAKPAPAATTTGAPPPAPPYSVLVQTPTGPNGEPRPMVVSADGEVIVDSDGRIVSDLGVYPAEGINELGGTTETAGIQEAVAYVLNTGGGRIFIRRGDYYPSKAIHVGVIARQAQVIIEGEGAATRIHLYNNQGKGQAWAFTVGTPGNSPAADQAPPPVFRGLAFVNDLNEGPPVGPIVTGGYYSGGGAVGNGVILEDITVVDPPALANNPSKAPSPIGWIWFNNSYGVRVRGFTYLGANPNNAGSTVILSDGVTFTEISDSYFVNTARGAKMTAIASGTGTLQISNVQILGFDVGINYGNTDGRSKLMVVNTVIGTERGGVEAFGAPLYTGVPLYVDYGFVDAMICCSRLGGVLRLLDSVGRITISNSEVHPLTVEAVTRGSPQSDLLLTIEGSRVRGQGSGPLLHVLPEGSSVRVRLIGNYMAKSAGEGQWSLIDIPDLELFEARGNYIELGQGFDVVLSFSESPASGFYEFSDNVVAPSAQPAYLLNGGVSITAPFIVRNNKFLSPTSLAKSPLTGASGLALSDNLNLSQ